MIFTKWIKIDDQLHKISVKIENDKPVFYLDGAEVTEKYLGDRISTAIFKMARSTLSLGRKEPNE